MGTTVRSRRIDASADSVWEVVSDPHHLPRWWPAVTRVEDVGATRFTTVIPTKRGKPVRLDHQVIDSQAPARHAWAQDLEGTPFERLLTAWTTTVTLEPDGERCLVTLEERQQLRGSFRAGLVLQRRPARRRLDAALDGLARLFP
jgi:uncharacterized protein YndB with AHSA1/START domain